MTNEDQTMCCQCTPKLGTRFGGERSRPPSMAIIEAVAAAEGVTPAELDLLSDAINLEAIDQLLTSQDDMPTCIHLRFLVGKWNVFVRSDGATRVGDPDRQTTSAPVFQKPLND